MKDGTLDYRLYSHYFTSLSWAKMHERSNQKGFVTPKVVSHYLPNNVLPTHLTKAQQEVLLGLQNEVD